MGTEKRGTPRKGLIIVSRSRITLHFGAKVVKTKTNLFGVSSSFVCLCIKEVSKAITRKLKTGLLCVPRGRDFRDVMGLYKDKWGFPASAGAIDGTHIPIQTLVENHTDYVNRKS